MKKPLGFALVSVVWLCITSGCGDSQTRAPERPPMGPASVYEYKVMSLLEMFSNSEAAKKKVLDMMVQPATGPRRTDMDAADYHEALNRLSQEGWEPVTVTKSNYWVFRRLKGSPEADRQQR